MWKSHAQWPRETYVGINGDCISTDTHTTREGAEAVCDGLRREGFGGQGESFPIKTWITEERP